MGIMQEFKEFAVKGNVVDMAVGIIIGAAFNSIVSSLVDGIVMPPIGVLIGGVDFSELSWTIQAASGDMPAVAIKYGAFIQTLIDFIIIAFTIFMMVKGINSLKRKQDESPTPPAPPAKDVQLLEEIRDLIRAQESR